MALELKRQSEFDKRFWKEHQEEQASTKSKKKRTKEKWMKNDEIEIKQQLENEERKISEIKERVVEDWSREENIVDPVLFSRYQGFS